MNADAKALAVSSSSTWRGAEYAVIAITSAGLSMVWLDVTAVNVALTDAAASVQASSTTLAWIADSYTLAFASLLLAGGWVGDRIGASRAISVGLGAFAGASLLCGLANQMPLLLAGRMLQGAAAALFMPASLSILREAFPEPSKQAKAVGSWSSIASIALAAGPVLGGGLVSLFGWRSIFLINVPLGVLASWTSGRLPFGQRRARDAWDMPGQVLSILALAGLTYLIIEGPAARWRTPPVIVSGAITIITAAAIVLRRARYARVSGMSSTPRWAANSVGWCLNFGFLVLLLAFTLLLEKTEGRSAIDTGLYLLPLTGMMGIGNIVSGVLIARLGWRLPVGGGMCLAGLMCLVFALRVQASYISAGVMLAVIGLGVSLAAPGITASVLASASDAEGGTAAAQLTVSRQIGGTVGTAVVGSIVAAATTGGLALALRMVIALGGIVWLAGALLVGASRPSR